ncbi:MAG: hypothetical protein KA034_01530 [Candidatus Moranbacteria bacterium]|nr:hypothetical protein [Candidatus Moranbacteria bacterium]
MKKFFIVASFLLCFFVASERVEAKSVSWSSGVLPELLYYYNGGDGVIGGFTGGWWWGLKDEIVSISYNAQVKDDDKNVLLNEGDSVGVGTHISFNPVQLQDTDISWFGAGRGGDSPYGHWINNAAHTPKSCDESDYAGSDLFLFGTVTTANKSDFAIYIPLSVNPPNITYDHLGSTASLSCDISGRNCTVMSSGSIVGHINYSNTYGRFYYRYFISSVYGCVANNVPMRKKVGETSVYTFFGISTEPVADASDYILPIPAQTISFNLTAVSNNNPPSIPAVTPQPFNGNTNTAYPFTFTSTDPDNDQIAYEVDWNNDSLPDEGTPFVASGTSQSRSNAALQWITAGTYSFKVRARDNQGNISAWTTSNVTLVPIVNGTCGLASGLSFDTLNMLSPGLCASGTQASFLSTGTGWTWGCNGSGGGTSTLPNACTATAKTYTLSAVKNLGPSAAGTIIDTTPTAMSIDSAIPRNTESVPYNSSRTLRANPTSSSISWSGCTSVSGNDCIVNNIIADKTVTATFTRLPEPGICGSSDGQSFETLNAGSSGLCSSGAIAGFSLSGQTYSWNCNGSFGSPIDVSCSASQIRNYNWKEVSP